MEREDIVAAIVAAAGGKLVGRVRLQKTAYLLDQRGLNSGFDYEYHHYGPYSRDLDNAMLDAWAFGLVDESFDRRESDGARYSIFSLQPGASAKDEAFGKLGRDRAAALIQKFANINVTVLELAATIDWLWRKEGYSDWRTELTRRKGAKVQGGRLEQAINLLNEIGLPPP
ncbi:MAG TPA: hypothetical protein VNK48_15985 [Xanthobacteraceae bacterium]|nr:hypothetical protein [Xanthobacteraceae bacterium]